MARGQCRPEVVIAGQREAEILLAQGMKAPDMAREQSIQEVTYCGLEEGVRGMRVDRMKRQRVREQENGRLRMAVSDPTRVDA